MANDSDGHTAFPTHPSLSLVALAPYDTQRSSDYIVLWDAEKRNLTFVHSSNMTFIYTCIQLTNESANFISFFISFLPEILLMTL